MKTHINKLKKYIENNYIFFNSCIDVLGNDIYFCKCGHKNVVNPNESSYAILAENIDEIDSSHLETAFRKANLICPYCQINYSTPEIYTNIQNINTDFFDKYDIHEDGNYLTIFKYRAKTLYDSQSVDYAIKISESYIKIAKKSNKIKYKGHADNKDKVVNLSDVVRISEEFFSNGSHTQITDGFINVHDFLGRVAKIIWDSKNMRIIEELMNQMIGKSGTNILQRVLAIFMGIMCYPSLSTIALTKGNTFLYDLMKNCPLPTPKYLKKNKATAPLSIFNTLISLKNNDLQKELDKDDTNILGYAYKSSTGDIYNIKYQPSDIKKIDSDSLVSSNRKIKGSTGAKLFVRDKIVNQKISPYIFNKLEKFTDYEKIIQWLKFVTYNDLISLLMKYDIELLNNVYNKIEFRDDIDKNRIEQFIQLMCDYAETELSKEHSSVKNRIQMKTSVVNHKYEAVKFFDFNLYDDCMRMIVELNWSPNKVLYKTKSFNKLNELHDKLIEFRSFISDKDANKNYIEYSSVFKYLEGKHIDEEKRFSLDVTLISTPEELLNTAIEMHNCAGSYINRVAKGQYVPFVVYDNSPKRQADEYYKYMMILDSTSSQ